MENKIDFLPDIFQYLEQADNGKSVSPRGLEELIYKVHASTGIRVEASSAIVKLFFQEIRNAILRGDSVLLGGFGKFSLSSPKISKNKKKIFPKFKPYKKLIKKMNHE